LPETSGPWFTTRRLRTHAAILLIVMWAGFAWDYAVPGLRDRAGQIKGADFLHLYTIGTLARERRGSDLYDRQAQEATMRRLVPEARGLLFLPLYPPQVSLLFSWLSRFPYGAAFLLWSLLSASLYGASCYAVFSCCSNLKADRVTVALCVLAYPAFWALITWGQTSALALACFALAFRASASGQRLLAGLALGCLAYKPQLGLVVGMVYLLAGEWQAICGAGLSAGVQFAAGWAYYGTDPLLAWVRALGRVSSEMNLLEPRPYLTHCLRTFWSLLLPWPVLSAALYALTAILALIVALRCWRSRAGLDLKFSALLLTTVLVSPHLTVYDLVILAPALLLLANRAAASRDTVLRRLLYGVCLLPLFGLLTRWTHLQLSVIAMAALLAWITRTCAGRSLEPAV